jgi:hypothetical protein
MKIEFLADGAEDCPLIRLYDYRVEEIEMLRQACRELSDGRIAEYRLHGQPWIDAINGCRFTWCRGKKNLGVRQRDGGLDFVLQYSDEGWRELEGLLEPFARAFSGGFQWLSAQGEINMLISQDGSW